MLREVSVDEGSMAPLHAFSATDKLSQGINGNDTMFGGAVFLRGGDFRQVLPVVQHGHPIAIIEKCIKNTSNWANVKNFHLIRNMRVQCDEIEFAKWLLKLDNDELSVKRNQPFEGCITDCVITSVFGNQFAACFLAVHMI